MTLATINHVRYAGFDFDTHVDDLRARIQVKFAADYNDFALASMGMMLLDIIAFGLDTLSFYVDRRATEVYLSTARTRRGVSRLSRQLGYKMGGAVSSSGDLSVSIDTPQIVNVSILENFQFRGPGQTIFRATRDVTWTPAEQTSGLIKQVPVSEGTLVTETFSSDGTPNQVFDLSRVPDGQYISTGSVSTTVDGAPFDEVDFLDYGATDQFEVAYNDDPPTLRFGDGTIGNIPKSNATINVSYVATFGKPGNVGPNTIQDVVSPLVVVGNTIDLTINNARKTSGGDDPETLEHAKAYAGRVFNSRRVAITRNDYNALSGSFADPVFGRVAVAQAISSRSAATDLFLQTQLSIIFSALYAPVAAIRQAITDGDAALAAIQAALGTGTSPLDETTRGAARLVASSVSQVEANIASTQASLRANRSLTFEIEDQVTQGKSTTDSSSATTPEKTAIKAFFDDITSKSQSIRAAIELQLQTLGTTLDETDKIGESVTSTQVDGTDSYLKIIEDQTNVALVQVGDSASGLFFIFDTTLQAAADTLDPDLVNNGGASIAAALQNISDHVDTILASDCQANLVTVPILTRDAAGFYTEPSNGLVDVLQIYLTDRKEVTQTVRVVSGGNYLIYPVMAVRLGVKQGYSLEKTRTATETAIDALLRDREFGVDLYISEIVNAILAVEGVAFVNVQISGYKTVSGGTTVYTDKLDSSGNLIVDDTEVITKRTAEDIVVTPEPTGQNLLLLSST
jgi:hypothetical protein